MASQLHQKVGILGGGQLGKMLCQTGSRFGLDLAIMESDVRCPASAVCSQLFEGSITHFDEVVAFGRTRDIVTIEIENVSVEALETLEGEGVQVYPSPAAMRIIRDKGLQKEFYQHLGLLSSPFQLFRDASEVRNSVASGNLSFPFVQKSRKDGYDGKGVVVVRSIQDLEELLDVPCLVEDHVELDKEIAVIVARDAAGTMVTFPVVEMQFHPTANLVEFVFTPSSLDHNQEQTACFMAKKLADSLNIVGLLAVEMFVDKQGAILINEVAPRPHNSGHHTIEACDVSQYEMHLRAILGLPLTNPVLRSPAVMINLLGEDGHEGVARYSGLEEALSLPGVFPHLYGKKMTKPFRKMGHVTILGDHLEEAVSKARFIQSKLKVIT
ncbi:MAG: 5-(carboxyamino)imidazole ribonucleotide synthase [Saprospiraceae bacterium]|jgi:5-(carboxyamino)imidazole ribonucleotide synthase|nr:5-(carboxyamino)imidazole ribonucleotide synthase [Saprospiraceae bacterium]